VFLNGVKVSQPLVFGDDPMSSISKRALVFSFAAAMAAWCVLAAPACAGSIPVYASGHSDLCADYNSTEGIFELHYHFHEGEYGLDEDGNHLGYYEGLEWVGEYEPSELYTRVSDATKRKVSATLAPFIGAPVGADYWRLPQTSQTGVPFLGMGTEELKPSDWSGNINYTLKDVSGPGQFSMWAVDGEGVLTTYWTTSDGISPSDVYGQLADVHAHTNFGFTAEGVYNVQMQLSGTRIGVGAVSSEVETFTFLVGSSTVPEPGTIAMLSSGAVGVALSFWKRRHSKARWA
jgi:surface-anchored protein